MWKKYSIIGFGAIAAALCNVLAKTENFNVSFVAIEMPVADSINDENVNPKYFPSIPIGKRLNATTDHSVSIIKELSSGIPVIATNVGGTSEIVNNELGYLADENITPEKLSTLIQNFHHRNDKSLFRAKAAIVFNEKCNAQLNYSKFSKFIEQIDDL